MDEESKKLIAEIFAILELSEEEQKRIRWGFEKKTAEELLYRVQSELPQEYQDFIATEGPHITDPQHPMILKIQEKLKNLRSKGNYLAITNTIVKSLLRRYAEVKRNGLSADKVERLDVYLAKL